MVYTTIYPAREQACTCRFFILLDHVVSVLIYRCRTDLLLSAAPIESHVGAVVASIRPLTGTIHTLF